jgi:putative heme-binding domain-containing protein
MRWFLLAAIVFCAPVVTFADDPLGGDVRKTEPNSPDAQLKMFHVPEGFQVQLIAADPDINKPMNLAFDARGRLWVTETHLYPMPAKDAASKKDRIRVIELAEDGHAAKITTFADNLNIPVGIYPIGDGSRAIAYDVNNVCLYTDTDGDGKSDERRILYSGWGYERDTHGMASNFRRGFDGWLYGCHGFNNISDVKSNDGDSPVHMQSGNTYRMRLDGSQIEMFTIGQINPFGMSMDPLGNIYTSDSHSKPIYQLLRGGRYEAFDRNTDDGLGLAPRMMEHLHGSTAIAGSCFYAATQLPEEFRGNVFVGNVVTGKINRDKLEYTGSTPRAIEQPDLLSCDDPWFRPVNTILGPDGALYVADFYNRIIAHYEVKLDHPGRDYQRGRIWRLSYKKPTVEKFDISKSDVNELIAKLNDPNLLVRQLATDQLSDRVGKDAIDPVKRLLAGDGTTATATQKIHAMWVLHRLGAADESIVKSAAADADATVRVHAMRVIAESNCGRDLAVKGLNDKDPLVRRCAADALGQHADVANIRPLLDVLAHADAADTHLIYVLRMSLRNQLRPPDNFAKLKDIKLTDAEVLMLADMSVAIDTPQAATFLLDHINQLAKDKAALTKYLQHAVRFATAPNVAPLAALMREKFADDLDLQLEMFNSVRQGLEQRGQPLPDEAKQWGEALATQVLKNASGEMAWTNTPLAADAAVSDPWDYEIRRCGDQKRIPLLSSLPGGEQATAVLRSKPFTVPPKLVFFLAGHNGAPSTPEQSNNIVRLKLQSTNETIAEKKPPRDDVARKVTWDLSAHAGQQAYLEITDADPGNAYAWLAFGRFNPSVIEMPRVPVHAQQRRLRAAADFATVTKLPALAPEIEHAMLDHRNEIDTRAAMAAALAALHADASVPAMKQIIGESAEPMKLRDRVAAALGAMATPSAQQAIVESFRLAPRELQTSLANALASNTASAETLLQAVAEGKAPPALLMDLGIHDRLAAANVPDLDKRVKKLTQGVAAPKEQLEKLIADRRAAFKALQPSPAPQSGQTVFAKNCMVCHTIDGHGGVVGPQLAGLSKRGIDRVVEDVLDPNRNLDPAFRYSTLILKDGHLVTGLQKRAEGETLVFADTTGKEVTVRKGDIQKRIESPSSLMPANFAEIISADDFNNLMAYLLSK